MFNFIFFKSTPAETNSIPENSWDPNTVAMKQPSSPAAPSTDQKIVSEQPTGPEQMQMQLRGGGAGGFCCGLCAGLTCAECCCCCC